MKRSREASEDGGDELTVSPATLVAWVAARGGSGTDGVAVRGCGGGGRGLFARRAFAAGDTILSLPQSCVLTAEKAAAAGVGVAARAAAKAWGVEAVCTDEVLLWLTMCVGRVDPSHPWHSYLACLPTAVSEPCRWPRP